MYTAIKFVVAITFIAEFSYNYDTATYSVFNDKSESDSYDKFNMAVYRVLLFQHSKIP